MRTFARALLLYWGVYALDFATSSCFILMGYGGAETNQFQRALVASPGPASFLSWASNQGVWIGVGALGVLVLAASPAFVPKTFLGATLGVLSLARLYGVATNLALTFAVFSGTVLPPVGLFLIIGTVALLPFRGALLPGIAGRLGSDR